MRKISDYILHPGLLWIALDNHNCFNWIPDYTYLSFKYRIILGRKMDYKHPKTYNEKIQWLKLYDRKPIYTEMVDKYAAKSYVARTIGQEYIIPTIGVWDKFDDISFDELPNSFVLKCSHDSGSIVLVPNKGQFDYESAKSIFENKLKRNYFYNNREWPYKDVKPRIIAENYLTDESGTELKDYKIFSFNGNPRIIQVDYNRFIDHRRNIYDTDWNLIDVQFQYQSDKSKEIEKPKSLHHMLELAKKLSKGIPFVRIDFYCIDEKVYFGELTFYPEAGFGRFDPPEFELELGNLLELPST